MREDTLLRERWEKADAAVREARANRVRDGAKIDAAEQECWRIRREWDDCLARKRRGEVTDTTYLDAVEAAIDDVRFALGCGLDVHRIEVRQPGDDCARWWVIIIAPEDQTIAPQKLLRAAQRVVDAVREQCPEAVMKFAPEDGAICDASEDGMTTASVQVQEHTRVVYAEIGVSAWTWGGPPEKKGHQRW